MHSGRIQRLFIIYIPLALIVISSFIFLIRIAALITGKVPDIIESLASNTINGTLDIGRIDIDYAKGVVIRDISIVGNNEESPTIILPKATININLKDVIFKHQDIQSAIEMVDIEKPIIRFARNKSGQWNIYDLITMPRGRKELRFSAPIQIRSADIMFKDFTQLSTQNLPQINRVVNLNALIEFSSRNAIDFSAEGNDAYRRVKHFNVKGMYKIMAQSYTVDIGFVDASTQYWSKYPYDSHLAIKKGIADGVIHINKKASDEPIEYLIKTNIRDTALKFDEIRHPIDEIMGQIELSRNIVIVNVDGRFESSPIIASGYVVDFKSPQLALDVTSNDLNLREAVSATVYANLFNQIGLPSSGKVSARVVGPTASPCVGFNLSAPYIIYNGMKIESIDTNGVYENDRITLAAVSAKGYGGAASLNGTVDFQKQTKVNLAGTVKSMSMHEITPLKKLGLAGIASGSFLIQWQPNNIKADYVAYLQNGHFGDMPLDRTMAQGSYANGIANIALLETGTAGGRLSGSGTIGKDKSINFDVCGTGFDIGTLLSEQWDYAVSGDGQFAGKISGNLDSPKFDGVVEAYDVSTPDADAERISGLISANKASIKLDDLMIFKYPGDVQISGIVRNPLSKQPSFALDTVINSIDMEKTLKKKITNDLSGGILWANGKIQGTMAAFTIEGSAKVTDALYQDIPIDSLTASAAYRNKDITFDSVELKSGKAYISATGKIARDQSINAEVKGHDIPLNRISDYMMPYAVAAGTVDFTGAVNGTIPDPEVEIDASGQNPIINGRKFTSINAKAGIYKDHAEIKEIRLSDADSIYQVADAAYHYNNKSIEGNASITNGKGSALISMIELSPYVLQPTEANSGLRSALRSLPRPFDANVNASISGGIQFSNEEIRPNLSFSSSIKDMEYGTDRISDIDIGGSWRDGVFSLDRLEASEGDMNIIAKANLGPEDAVYLAVDAHNINTASLRQFTKIADNFSGYADVTIVASGSKYKPDAKMSLEIVNPIIAGYKFDRLRAGLSSLGGAGKSHDLNESESLGLIDVDDITLVLNDHDIRVSGYVPVDWAGLKLRKDAPILLETSIDPDVLSIISALAKTEIGLNKDGHFEGFVRMAGTILQPEFTGELVSRSVYVNIPGVTHSIGINQIDLSLLGNKIMVNTVKGESPLGGAFNAKGDITFEAPKPLANINVDIDKMKISERNISGVYGEEVSVVIAGNLGITGPIMSPLIKGNLTVDNGQLRLASKSDLEKPAKAITFNPDFDINIALGNNLEFKTSMVKMPLSGSASVKGRLQSITVDAMMDISGGTIAFPMHSMKLMPGSSAVVRVSPGQPPSINVDLQGQSRVIASTALGQRRLYTVTMVARGTIDDLDADFTSSPPGLSEEEILALLTGQRQIEQILAGDTDRNLGEELSAILSSALLPSVFDPLTESFGDILGLDEVGIEYRYDEPVQISLGKRLWGDLTLSYSTYMGHRPSYADSMYELRLTKQFARNLEIGISVDENRIYRLLVGGRIRF